MRDSSPGTSGGKVCTRDQKIDKTTPAPRDEISMDISIDERMRESRSIKRKYRVMMVSWSSAHP